MLDMFRMSLHLPALHQTPPRGCFPFSNNYDDVRCLEVKVFSVALALPYLGIYI
jgi:hypothetical protein